jgi:hypothetical protein
MMPSTANVRKGWKADVGKEWFRPESTLLVADKEATERE